MKDQSKIHFAPADKILEFTGILLVASLFVLPFGFYADLPDEIPSHFGIRGNPDAWSGKASIWTLPVVGLVLYAGLSVLNFLVLIKGYGSKSQKSQPISREKILRLMQWLKVLLVLSFTYITCMTIRVSIGKAEGLGVWFIPAMIIFMTFVPILFLLGSGKKK